MRIGRSPMPRFRVGAFDVLADRNLVLLDGEEFYLEPKVVQLLCVLAEKAGDVLTRDELLDVVWQVEHGSDESLTRAISLLRKVFRRTAGGDGYIETISKRGYRLNAPVTAAAPPASAPPVPLLPTPAAPIPGEPIPAEPGARPPPTAATAPGAVVEGPAPSAVAPGVPAPAIVRQRASPRAIWAATLVLLVFSVAGGWVALRPSRTPETGTAIVQDLVQLGTFRTLGGDAGLSSFAAALRTDTLARLSEARVPARLAEASGDGRPEFELDGEVERIDGLLRVQLGVRMTRDGVQVWTERLEQPEAEPGILRDRAASRGASMVHCGTGFRDRDPTMSLDVLRLFFQVCAARWHPVNARSAALLSESILAADPDSPLAQGFHAFTLSFWERAAAPQEAERFRVESEVLARKAIAADPGNGFARFALARREPMPEGLAAAERHLIQGISGQSPPVPPLSQYALHLRVTGRIKEAETAFLRLLALDPFFFGGRFQYAQLLASVGRIDEAKEESEKAVRMQFDRPGINNIPLVLDFFYGDPATVRAQYAEGAAAERLARMDARFRTCLEVFLAARAAGGAGAAGVEDACKRIQPDYQARMFANLGDLDRAFAVFERIDPAQVDVAMALWFPEMASFRRDPRFWQVAARFGLSAYWMEADKWPDVCGQEIDLAACRKAVRASIPVTE